MPYTCISLPLLSPPFSPSQGLCFLLAAQCLCQALLPACPCPIPTPFLLLLCCPAELHVQLSFPSVLPQKHQRRFNFCRLGVFYHLRRPAKPGCPEPASPACRAAPRPVSDTAGPCGKGQKATGTQGSAEISRETNRGQHNKRRCSGPQIRSFPGL